MGTTPAGGRFGKDLSKNTCEAQTRARRRRRQTEERVILIAITIETAVVGKFHATRRLFQKRGNGGEDRGDSQRHRMRVGGKVGNIQSPIRPISKKVEKLHEEQTRK